ncbi:MAG: hypothetical protein MHMPM18_000980 [Marteilia pararefringens]
MRGGLVAAPAAAASLRTQIHHILDSLFSTRLSSLLSLGGAQRTSGLGSSTGCWLLLRRFLPTQVVCDLETVSGNRQISADSSSATKAFWFSKNLVLGFIDHYTTYYEASKRYQNVRFGFNSEDEYRKQRYKVFDHAVRRMSESKYNDRHWRLMRSQLLDLQKTRLPEEQWVYFRDDKDSLIHLVHLSQLEMSEKAEWHSKY